jgi:hypothetical protein
MRVTHGPIAMPFFGSTFILNAVFIDGGCAAQSSSNSLEVALTKKRHHENVYGAPLAKK